jgi:hypothetical protein
MGYIPASISILQVIAKISVRQSCYVTTTANITLSGIQTIDGLSVPGGTRVLVKNQTDARENGIYVAAAGAWSRSADADTSGEVESGMFIFIQAGSLQADTQWYLATEDPILLGTSNLNFYQFGSSGGGGGGSIVAGNGLMFSGIILDIVPDVDGSIVVGADSIKVGVLATDAQHGNRGNGSLHSVADSTHAGFMSSSDFNKLATLNTPYVDVYTATAGQTDFPLSHIPSDSSQILFFINGQQQTPTTDWYMFSATVIRWNNSYILGTTDTIWIKYDGA